MKNKKSKTSLNIASVQMHITQDQNANLKSMEEYLQHVQNTFPQIDMIVFIPNPLIKIFWKKEKTLKNSQMLSFLVQVLQIVISEI